MEFKPVDMVLRRKIDSRKIKKIKKLIYLSAALKTPATKRPGRPGIDAAISITKNGSSWSGFLIC